MTDVTTVLINVTRNNNRPIWRVAGNATIEIRETQALSDSIGSVCYPSILSCYNFIIQIKLSHYFINEII